MNALLALSRVIDALNDRVGRTVYWLVLAAVFISAANAIVRKAFDMSSNAYLEVQWYLFSAVFLLCAGYTLLKNEHIRIDVDRRPVLAPHADVDRRVRHRVLPVSDGRADPLRVVAVVRARVAQRRGVAVGGRAHPLAREDPGARSASRCWRCRVSRSSSSASDS